MTGLLDFFSHWNVPPDPQSKLQQADVIATHEFGDQKVPSGTTTSIVRRAVELAKKFNKPLICQYPGNEIAEAAGIRPAEVIQ